MDPTLVLLMAIRGTAPLLTEPIHLLRVTSLVVILPYMEVTEDTHPGPTTQPRLSIPLIPIISKDETVGAMSRVEETREEHTTNHYGARPIILE